MTFYSWIWLNVLISTKKSMSYMIWQLLSVTLIINKILNMKISIRQLLMRHHDLSKWMFFKNFFFSSARNNISDVNYDFSWHNDKFNEFLAFFFFVLTFFVQRKICTIQIQSELFNIGYWIDSSYKVDGIWF